MEIVGRDGRSNALLLYLLAWLVIAVVAATTSFIALGRSSFDEWLTIFGYMFAYFYAWSALGLGIVWLVHGERRWQAGFRRQLPMHFVLLAVITVTLPFVLHPIEWRRWLIGDHAVGFHSLNAFVYAFILIAGLLWKAYRDGRERDRAAARAALREAELARSLDKSRMELLRAQINPHFLFNTLNSIAALVEDGARQEAYRNIELLAALLRKALDPARGDVVRLDEELDFVDTYIRIEQLRFEDKLVYRQDIDNDCRDARVPSLSLQPLVENAIKHGVALSSRPVTITVRARRNGTCTEIVVTDDGPGCEMPVRPGIGLSNVMRRLEYGYGGAATLDVSRGAERGTTVRMSVPAGSPAPPAGATRG